MPSGALDIEDDDDDDDDDGDEEDKDTEDLLNFGELDRCNKSDLTGV